MKYCSRPFNSLMMFPENISCCCSIRSDKNNKMMSTYSGNNSIGDLNNFWNSTSMQDLRACILKGDYDTYCKACYQKDTYVKELADLPFDAQRHIIDEEVIVDAPSNIEIAFDISCNLKCKSCRLDTASIVGGENRKRYDDVYNFLVQSSHKEISLFFNGGGDCFGFESFNFLKRIEDNIEQFPKLKFKVITNGQLFNERNCERIKNIVSRIQGIVVSVDAATKDTYEKIRINGKWETIQTNLQLMKQICKQNKAWFVIVMVIQKGNYKEMGLFREMGDALGATTNFEKLRDWYGVGVGHRWYKENAVHLSSHPDYDDFLHEVAVNKIYIKS